MSAFFLACRQLPLLGLHLMKRESEQSGFCPQEFKFHQEGGPSPSPVTSFKPNPTLHAFIYKYHLIPTWILAFEFEVATTQSRAGKKRSANFSCKRISELKCSNAVGIDGAPMPRPQN